jgi:hypothetical protein
MFQCTARMRARCFTAEAFACTPAVKCRISLLLDLRSRFSQLLSSEALQPSGTFFVFSTYLSNS